MLAVLLHRHTKKLSEIQQELKYENISVDGKTWDPDVPLQSTIFDADVIVLLYEEQHHEVLNLIREIRRKKSNMPILVLDENFSEEIRSAIFSSGANAYLNFPISSRELAVKIKDLVSQKENIDTCSKWMKAFGLWLDISRRAVKRSNKWIPLRNKEFALLEFLIINRGRVLTRNSILEHVWDRNANLVSNTVDVHVNRLRRKIDDPFNDKLIHTVHCIGYCFDRDKN
jgi:DNA-binding response OmpR family regulator